VPAVGERRGGGAGEQQAQLAVEALKELWVET
jgi:hypothetical protein